MLVPNTARLYFEEDRTVGEKGFSCWVDHIILVECDA